MSRNRRFNFTKSAQGIEYFGAEAMKMRDPVLYELLVGQFLAHDQPEAAGIVDRLYNNLQNAEFQILLDRKLDGETIEEVEVDDDEIEQFRMEFERQMKERFMAGQDTEFDYTLVDSNPEYDDIDQISRDLEERYFEDADPSEINTDSGIQDF